MKLSAVILTLNEEKNIERSIRSCIFANEIIILDDFSTDRTLEIAKNHKVTIIQRKLNDNYSNQRNYGLKEAKGDWIIYLDADEEISNDLKKEIQLFLDKENDFKVAYIKRRDFWWGKVLKHGEVRKVYTKGLTRLIKKNSGLWKGQVHEEFVFNGLSTTLDNYINHYPHPTIKEFIESINKYSSLRSEELYRLNKKTNILDISFTPFFKFINNYIFKLGFLDGIRGFIYSFLMSFHSFLVRTKLYRLNKLIK